MFQSVVVYTFSALLLFFSGKNSERSAAIRYRGKSVGFKSFITNPGIICSIVIFALLAGLRNNVGVDYPTYLETYLKIQNGQLPDRDSFETGFVFLSKMMASLDFSKVAYFAFWGILQIGFVYYAFREKRYLLPYIGMCIVLGPWFLDWMNGIRQCVVSCAFIFAVEFVEKRKPIHYLVFIVLASYIHKSVYILLPVYFLAYSSDKWVLNKWVNIAIVFGCTVLGNVPTWLSALNNLSGLLGTLGYDHYADNMSSMTEENIGEMAWGPSRISLYLVSLMIIWYYPKMKVYYNNEKYLGLCFILFLIGTCGFELFANTSHIFLRPVEYFSIFRLPMAAYLFYYFKRSNKRLMFCIFLMLVCAYVYISAYKGSLLMSRKLDHATYRFVWDAI